MMDYLPSLLDGEDICLTKHMINLPTIPSTDSKFFPIDNRFFNAP